jgi:hypothetical protein
MINNKLWAETLPTGPDFTQFNGGTSLGLKQMLNFGPIPVNLRQDQPLDGKQGQAQWGVHRNQHPEQNDPGAPKCGVAIDLLRLRVVCSFLQEIPSEKS